jgi:hypothetical protein
MPSDEARMSVIAKLGNQRDPRKPAPAELGYQMRLRALAKRSIVNAPNRIGIACALGANGDALGKMSLRRIDAWLGESAHR